MRERKEKGPPPRVWAEGKTEMKEKLGREYLKNNGVSHELCYMLLMCK